MISIIQSKSIALKYLVKPFLLTIFLYFIKISNCTSRRTQLYQNYRSLLDSDIPVILQLKHQLPQLTANKTRVFLEKVHILRDFNLGEVI